MQFAVSKRILLVCLLFSFFLGAGCTGDQPQPDPQQTTNIETTIPEDREIALQQTTDETRSLEELQNAMQTANKEERYVDAMAIYKTAMLNYPSQAAAIDLTAQAYDEFLSAAKLLYHKKQYTESIELYTLILDSFENADPKIREVIPNTLFAQALNQKQNKQFAEAVDTFTKINTYFPASAFDKIKISSLQKTYFNWAIDCFENENYELGLEKLDYIMSTWPNTEIAGKADTLYLTASLDYVAYLHTHENYEKEIEILKVLQKQYSENELLADVQSDIYSTQELWANQLVENGGLFLALENYKYILLNNKDKEMIARIQEPYDELLSFLITDEGEEGQKLLKRIMDEKCWLYDYDKRLFPDVDYSIPFSATKMLFCDNVGYDLPEESMADKVTELRYWAMNISYFTTIENIERCDYEDDHALIRQQHYYTIRICGTKERNCFDGELIAGPEPAPCPKEYTFTTKYEVIRGEPIQQDQIMEWLEPWLQ